MSTTPVIESVRHLVAQAVETARNDGVVRLETMPDIQVEHPGNPDHGDFATNLPSKAGAGHPHQSLGAGPGAWSREPPKARP